MKKLHVSGRWDAPDDVVRAAVRGWVEHLPVSVSHTEARRHRDSLNAEALGYHHLQGTGTTGQPECALSVRHDVTVKNWYAARLSKLPIPRRGGAFCWALVVELEASHDAPAHTQVVLHMPSGVEGMSGIRDNEQGAVYRDCIAGLQKLLAGISGPVVVTGDWNLNLKRAWVRRYFRAHFPGFRVTRYPDGTPGTHGRRVIDFSIVRGFISTGRVTALPSASDHRAIVETLKENTVTKGIYPAAKQLIIPPGENDPAIVPRIAVLHVDAGNATSLYTFFRDRSGGIESHFFVKKDGTVEQYRNIFWQADANLDGNDFAVSIETQGFGSGEWTPNQMAAIKALLTWLHAEAGIPLIRCTAWDGRGVGYHTMWGAPSHWTPVAKTCPGPDRIKQFDTVIVPWMKSLGAPPADPKPTHVELARDHVRDAYRSLRLAVEELEAASDTRVAAKAWIPSLKSARRQLGLVLQSDPER